MLSKALHSAPILQKPTPKAITYVKFSHESAPASENSPDIRIVPAKVHYVLKFRGGISLVDRPEMSCGDAMSFVLYFSIF